MNFLPKLGFGFFKDKVRSFVPQIFINYIKHFPIAFLAAFYYSFPARKLTIIGVTGTDGKTTTVNLIYHLLHSAGFKVAMVSTVSAKIGDEEIDTGFHVTASDPWLLQKLLRKMVDQRMKYVVLEATSHGLDQFRFWGINFEIGVLTNITHEHLDYHKTYEKYLSAKTKLFQNSKVAILNKDDQSYDHLNAKIKNQKSKIILTYGIKNKADFTPKTFPFKTSLPGEYNQYNCLAAIAVAFQLGISEKIILEAVTSFKGVTGRMEEINEDQNFRVIVDFAHTPNALEQALSILRREKGKGKLIAVFGCAGLRDKEKRPMMGEVACRLADLVVLTAEDPRTENVNNIIGEIAEGCKKGGGVEGKSYYKIPDRREAINYAIQRLAGKDDIAVICGKGHEKSMCFGYTEYLWSDQEVARKALRKGTALE